MPYPAGRSKGSRPVIDKSLPTPLPSPSTSRSFQGFVCLMQLSTLRQDYLIDTLAVREDMGLLADLFADHTVVKVGPPPP